MINQPVIVQSSLPFDISKPVRLPGIAPLDPRKWVHVDEAYREQMSLRRALIRDQPKDVIAYTPNALPAAQELLQTVLDHLPDGFKTTPGGILAPDGHEFRVDIDRPLETIGSLVQEDMCLLQDMDGEHVLTAAVLCFPASWLLSEKIERPLTHIHGAVAEYNDEIAKRVQRLFDGVKPEKPLWRWNALWNDTPDLFQPRSVHDPRQPTDAGTEAFLRSERQCILRLPKTKAVVFSIHSFVLRHSDAQKAYCMT
ncbi:MAG: heme-dependent oxidative N-demethylase family protein [Pelagimonas sp.]|uniref:heme-dependent oxidative N-demethylase family protein n=1 Tax=Pelagimonas sp. TaxID=2073170 RepID=UPI003D6ABF98